MANVEEAVQRAIARFKSLFGAEAEVQVLELGDKRVLIWFGGNMCYTCGTYDYFEDFAYMLSDELGEEWSVAEYTQLDDGTYIVEFRPKEIVDRVRRHIKVIFYNLEFGEEEYNGRGEEQS